MDLSTFLHSQMFHLLLLRMFQNLLLLLMPIRLRLHPQRFETIIQEPLLLVLILKPLKEVLRLSKNLQILHTAKRFLILLKSKKRLRQLNWLQRLPYCGI